MAFENRRRARPWARLSSLLLALGVILSPAEVGAEPTAEDKETARSLLDAGHVLMESRDYAAALKSYKAAHDIMHVPTTGIEVGRALAVTGKLLEARDMLLWVVRFPRADKEPGAFTRARTEAEILADQLGDRIPSMLLHIKGPPPGATITVTFDGVPVPPAAVSAPRKLNPGEHLVVLSTKGFRREERRFNLNEADAAELTIVLQPAAPEPGDKAKTASAGSGLSPLVYIGFAAAGGGLVLGSVTGGFSLAAASRAEEKCPLNPRCPAEAREDIDAAIALANVSNVGFALGALGLGAGIYGILTSKSPPAQASVSSVRVTPRVGYKQIGLSVEF